MARKKEKQFEAGDNLGLKLAQEDQAFLIPCLNEFRKEGGEVAPLLRQLLTEHFRRKKDPQLPATDPEDVIAWVTSTLRRAANGEAAGPPLTARELQTVKQVAGQIGQHEKILEELDEGLGEWE